MSSDRERCSAAVDVVGHRIFYLAPPWPPPGEETRLSPEEARHAVRALRLRAGDELVLIDGLGQQAPAWVVEARGELLRVRPGPAVPCPAERESIGRLGLPLLRSAARMDWAIEKGTELGATAFEVYVADRSLKGVARGGEARSRRWGRIAQAAMKQSGRALWPPVRVHAGLDALLDATEATALIVADDRGAARPGAGSWAADAGGLLLLVGPEGGWSEREARRLDERGGVRLSLGPRRLRAETAAVALCAAVRVWAADGA